MHFHKQRICLIGIAKSKYCKAKNKIENKTSAQ